MVSTVFYINRITLISLSLGYSIGEQLYLTATSPAKFC